MWYVLVVIVPQGIDRTVCPAATASMTKEKAGSTTRKKIPGKR
jgi:hypothetical protein